MMERHEFLAALQPACFRGTTSRSASAVASASCCREARRSVSTRSSRSRPRSGRRLARAEHERRVLRPPRTPSATCEVVATRGAISGITVRCSGLTGRPCHGRLRLHRWHASVRVRTARLHERRALFGATTVIVLDDMLPRNDRGGSAGSDDRGLGRRRLQAHPRAARVPARPDRDPDRYPTDRRPGRPCPGSREHRPAAIGTTRSSPRTWFRIPSRYRVGPGAARGRRS